MQLNQYQSQLEGLQHTTSSSVPLLLSQLKVTNVCDVMYSWLHDKNC